jgi:hypothetical protein
MNMVSNHLTPERTQGAAIIMRAGLCLLIIVFGLALRKFGPGLGLPFPFVKYGGSILWGTMVFFLVGIAAPARSPSNIALIAATVAVCVELFRLVHTPGLDDFRLTTLGALLIGRVFSPWNMLAYGVGIVLGMLLDRLGASALTGARLSPRSTAESLSSDKAGYTNNKQRGKEPSR